MTRREGYTYGISGGFGFWFSSHDDGVKAGRGYMQAGRQVQGIYKASGMINSCHSGPTEHEAFRKGRVVYRQELFLKLTSLVCSISFLLTMSLPLESVLSHGMPR